MVRYYLNYCLKIIDFLTIDSILNLYLLYYKAEKERSNSEDKRTPIPYYVVGFFGELLFRREVR